MKILPLLVVVVTSLLFQGCDLIRQVYRAINGWSSKIVSHESESKKCARTVFTKILPSEEELEKSGSLSSSIDVNDSNVFWAFNHWGTSASSSAGVAKLLMRSDGSKGWNMNVYVGQGPHEHRLKPGVFISTWNSGKCGKVLTVFEDHKVQVEVFLQDKIVPFSMSQLRPCALNRGSWYSGEIKTVEFKKESRFYNLVKSQIDEQGIGEFAELAVLTLDIWNLIKNLPTVCPSDKHADMKKILDKQVATTFRGDGSGLDKLVARVAVLYVDPNAVVDTTKTTMISSSSVPRMNISGKVSLLEPLAGVLTTKIPASGDSSSTFSEISFGLLEYFGYSAVGSSFDKNYNLFGRVGDIAVFSSSLLPDHDSHDGGVSKLSDGIHVRTWNHGHCGEVVVVVSLSSPIAKTFTIDILFSRPNIDTSTTRRSGSLRILRSVETVGFCAHSRSKSYNNHLLLQTTSRTYIDLFKNDLNDIGDVNTQKSALTVAAVDAAIIASRNPELSLSSEIEKTVWGSLSGYQLELLRAFESQKAISNLKPRIAIITETNKRST